MRFIVLCRSGKADNFSDRYLIRQNALQVFTGQLRVFINVRQFAFNAV